MSAINALDHKTKTLVGYLDNNGEKVFWDDLHVQDLSGEHQFRFNMLPSIPEAAHYEDLTRIVIPDEDDGYEEFVIFRAQTLSNNKKTIDSTATYTQMNKQHILAPGKYTGTIHELADMVLPNTEWQKGFVEYSGIRTITLDNYTGAYSFLKRFESIFGVELKFQIKTSGSRISARYVHFLERIGQDTKKEIELGKDLIDITKTLNSEQIVTQLLCVGPEKEDGTRLVTYVQDKEAFQRWNDNGKHITGIYEPESDRTDMTLEELEQYGRTELNKRIASVIDYEITAASLESRYPHEKVRLGDRIRVKDPDFSPPLYADARVIRVERSLTDPSSKVYVIGEVKTYKEEDVFKLFRTLLRLNGVKMIESETAPDGQPKTIWIDKGTPLNTPHTFNFGTNEWEKFAPTNAGEIGGVEIGQQYNGVSITPENGMDVERTDTLVKTTVNATEGISIASRADDGDEYEKVFYANEQGKLTLKGITIVRDDGFKVVDNGMLSYDLNIQGVEPPFHTAAIVLVPKAYGQWYRSQSTTSFDLNQYRFKHMGRYLKINYRILAEAGNTAHFEIWRNGEIVASAFTSQTDPYDLAVLEGFTLTVDLGVPTGEAGTFQLRLRSTVAGLDSYAMMMGKWLEG